jgi:hypothetical protein
MKENQELQHHLREAQAKIAALETELRRGYGRAGRFSPDEPKQEPTPSGRRPGKGQFTHREMSPENTIGQTIECPLGRCPYCGRPLINHVTPSRCRSICLRFSRSSLVSSLRAATVPDVVSQCIHAAMASPSSVDGEVPGYGPQPRNCDTSRIDATGVPSHR